MASSSSTARSFVGVVLAIGAGGSAAVPVLPKHLAGIFLPVRLAVPGRVSADVARLAVRHRDLGFADRSFAFATDPGGAVDVAHGLSRYDFLFDVSSAPSG